MRNELDIVLDINGEQYPLRVEARRTLADTLREQCGLTGTNSGCEHGVCGSCTVLLDGQPVRSCLMFAVQAQGHQLRTVEGLAKNGQLHPLQQAFVDLDVPQCGYCQSGQIMTAVALLAKNPNPDDHLIDQEMTNICRCGTYQRIKAAIATASAWRAAGTSMRVGALQDCPVL